MPPNGCNNKPTLTINGDADMNKPFKVVNANGEEVHRYRSVKMANAYMQKHPGCSIRIVINMERRVY